MERHVNLTIHRIVFVKRNACFNLQCSFRETKKEKKKKKQFLTISEELKQSYIMNILC